MKQLIDHFLPAYHFRESHVCLVRCSPAMTLAAVTTCDLGRSVLVRTLFRLRGLPTAHITLAGMEVIGFRRLGQQAERELVIGLIGRFWTPSGDIQHFAPEGFKAFDRPAFAKVATNFHVRPHSPAMTCLTTETRVWCPTAASRRRFRRYWVVIRPFSGLVRREWLRLIKQQAEKAHRAGRHDITPHRGLGRHPRGTRHTASAAVPVRRRLRRVLAQMTANLLTPLVDHWVRRQEAIIRRKGRPLSRAERKRARSIALSDPARIRIQTVARIPVPGGRLLKGIARFSRVALADPVALTAGHGIYLCRAIAADPVVVQHELVHVHQYERLGRRAFLKQYIRDCLVEGYAASPLEIEARRISTRRDDA